MQDDEVSGEPGAKTPGARRTRWGLGCLTLMVACALGTLFLLWLGSREHFMVVWTDNAAGRRVGWPSIVWIPAPEHARENGLLQMRVHVSQLLASQARFASLLAFTPDGQRGVSLILTGGTPSINLNVEWRTEPQKERAIRTLFRSLKIPPSQDYLAANGGVANSTRLLTYPLPASVGPA